VQALCEQNFELFSTVVRTRYANRKAKGKCPHNLDLRWRAKWLHIAHQYSVSDIADKICISERTVCRYLAKFNTTGEVKSTLQKHGPSKLLGEYEQLVLLEIIAS